VTKLLSFLPLLAMLFFLACNNPNQVPTVAAAAPQPQPDAATPVLSSPADQTFQTTGPIVVENQVDVLALRAGVISFIQADIGKAVSKGGELATLDDRQIVAERNAAAAKLHSSEANLKDWEAETGMAEADFKRAQAMRDAGINTQEALDHARYQLIGSQYEIEKAKEEVGNAQNTLRALELEVEKTRITAPFDGIVARRYVRVGQSVAVGERLFWVTAVAPLQVKFTLPERLLGTLKPGKSVSVSSADLSPAPSHIARIVTVSPVVDPSSGTIEVLGQIEGPAPDLRPGMLANIRINLPQ